MRKLSEQTFGFSLGGGRGSDRAYKDADEVCDDTACVINIVMQRLQKEDFLSETYIVPDIYNHDPCKLGVESVIK